MFKELPDELNLHIFSFLAMKDLNAISATHQAGKRLANDDHLWQKKVRSEFYLNVPCDVNPKSFYIAMTQQCRAEQRLVTAYLKATVFYSKFLESDSEDTEPSFEEMENLDECLLFSRKTFIENLNQKINSLEDADLINNINTFTNLIVNQFCVWKPINTENQDPQTIIEIDKLSILMIFCKCNAYLSLRKVLNNEPIPVNHIT